MRNVLGVKPVTLSVDFYFAKHIRALSGRARTRKGWLEEERKQWKQKEEKNKKTIGTGFGYALASSFSFHVTVLLSTVA